MKRLLVFTALLVLFGVSSAQTLSDQYIQECQDSVIRVWEREIQVHIIADDTIGVYRSNGNLFTGDFSTLRIADSAYVSNYLLEEGAIIMIEDHKITLAPTYAGFSKFAIRKYYELNEQFKILMGEQLQVYIYEKR